MQQTSTQSRRANTKCAAGTGLGPGGYALTVTSGSSLTAKDGIRFQCGTGVQACSIPLYANGVKDVGEPGLAGWTISAYTDGNGDGTLSARSEERRVGKEGITGGRRDYTIKKNPGT